jgi:hypothetical protein
MKVDQAKRLKELETENTRLKRAVAAGRARAEQYGEKLAVRQSG